MSTFVGIWLTGQRESDLQRLAECVGRTEPLLTWQELMEEVFAIGIQSAWLRLSKGEQISPSTCAQHGSYIGASACPRCLLDYEHGQ